MESTVASACASNERLRRRQFEQQTLEQTQPLITPGCRHSTDAVDCLSASRRLLVDPMRDVDQLPE